MTLIEFLMTDMGKHYAAGLTVSMLDYTTYKLRNGKEKRIKEKRECLESIERLLDSETGTSTGSDNTSENVIEKNSKQYATNVESVKDYLRKEGKVKFELPLIQKIKDGYRHMVNNEWLNNMSNKERLGWSIGLEFIDTAVGFGYYMFVQGESPWAGFAYNAWQIPSFFGGLWTGAVIRKPIDWIMTSKEEREMIKTIDQALKETPILDIVMNYNPSEQVRGELKEEGINMYGAKLTGAGKNVYTSFQKYTGTVVDYAKEAKDAVTGFNERRKEREEAENQKRLDRFDEITRNK